VVSKIASEEYHDATEVDEAQEVVQVSIVSHKDATVVLEPGEQPLDLPSPPIPSEFATVLRRWDHAI